MPIGATIIPMIIYALVLAIGLLNAICPRCMWRIFQNWKATKEPSSAYFVAMRIGGVVVVAIMTALLLFPYFLN